MTEDKFQRDVRDMEVFSDRSSASALLKVTFFCVLLQLFKWCVPLIMTPPLVDLAVRLQPAQFLAAVKASGEALGTLQLMLSVGVPMTASIMVDSSAALAVVARKGNGKLRHVRVGHLWVQQVAADGGLKNHKVIGEENPE